MTSKRPRPMDATTGAACATERGHYMAKKKRPQPDPDPAEQFDFEDASGLTPKQMMKLPVEGLSEEELRRFRRKLDQEYTKQQDIIVDVFNSQPESDHISWPAYTIHEDEEE
jgi:hypothetical protein